MGGGRLQRVQCAGTVLYQCGQDPGLPGGNRRVARQFYWANRLIGALADAHFAKTSNSIERYQNAVGGRAHAFIKAGDAGRAEGPVSAYLEGCNEKLAAMLREETTKVLGQVLYEASNGMKNGFARSDA